MDRQDDDWCGGAAARSLHECQEVSVCELNGAERFLVWAIRWRSSAQDEPEFAAECLRDSFERAGLGDAQWALDAFVCATCPQRLSCSAAQRLGCWRLNTLEAHALHAVACLQRGLIGEAWRTLREVCPEPRLRSALEALQELGVALVRVDGQINPWTGHAPRVAAATAH